MLLSKWWEAPASSKGRLVDLPFAGMGSPPPHCASHQCTPWGLSVEPIHSTALLQPAHHPGLCLCGVMGSASRHRGTRCHVLALPVARASSSCHEQQRRADVLIGDLNTSGGAVPPECRTTGPGVLVSETPQGALIMASSCVLLWQWWIYQLLCYRGWYHHHECPNSLGIIFQSCRNKAAGVAFYIQALVSPISSSRSHRTTAQDQDAASLL